MSDMVGAVSGVVQGERGRLFLGRQDGFDLELFSSGQMFSEPSLLRWRRTITRRARELSRRGIPYIFFIVPDAPSVHAEDLPLPFRYRMNPPGRTFIEAMGDIPGVTFVYPLRALQNAKGGMDVYRRKDSHWTSYGAFIGYNALMDAIEPKVDCTRIAARDLKFTMRRSFGDLGSITEPEQTEDAPIVSIAGPAPVVIRHRDGVARQTLTESEFSACPSRTRALFFRDSFMTDLAPYLARSFSHMMTVGSTTRVHFDAIDNWEADIVVSQVAERKLPFLESDHHLESYETTYNTDFQSATGKRLLQARLLMQQDGYAALKMIENDLSVLRQRPDHAFSTALIYEACGLNEQANDWAQEAARQNRREPSYQALAARTSLAFGNFTDAVRLSRMAIEGAGGNGYFREIHAYALLQQRRFDEAVRAVEEGLAAIQDHANLWYWASVMHACVNDVNRAATCAREAVRLDTANPAYLENLRGLETA